MLSFYYVCRSRTLPANWTDMIKIINETKAIPLVKYYAAFSGIPVAALLISSFIPQASAADLAAFLVPDRDRSEVSFMGVRTITLSYPEGSTIAQELNGKNERLSFTLNGTAGGENNTGINEVIASINKALIEAKSPVQVSQAGMSYSGVLRGGPTSATVSYKVELDPTLERFVLQRGEGGQSGHIVDLEWRGIDITDPLVVSSPQNGKIAINQPIGFFQALHPDLAEKLLNSEAREIMTDPILNFKEFDIPMSSWHRLFDPVGSYGTAVGMQGTEGAKALSVYSLGESSLREGTHATIEKDATASINGANVNIHSQNPPPSAQITIAGYANQQENAGTEFAVVSAEAPEGVQTSTGGFPIQVLLVLGGMMGAIAIFILFKARK
jgi:hypothetical protein